MGMLTTVEGGFNITPPLSWKELRDKGFGESGTYADGYRAAKILVTSEDQETDEGTLKIRTGVMIVGIYEDAYKAYNLLKAVQEIIDAFPDHAYTGYFECTGKEPGDLWRVYVKDGQAIRVEPEIVWPDI